MSESSPIPFLAQGAIDRSVIIGAPEQFGFKRQTARFARISLVSGKVLCRKPQVLSQE
jgi:hypothetical protein